jgi:3-methyladenine DNA glycosylase AlkC
MAKKFKDYYGRECGEVLGAKIRAVYTDFDYDNWLIQVIKRTRGKEFLERQEILVDLLDELLPSGYVTRLKIFSALLGPVLETETGMFTHGWWLWPVGHFVKRFGNTHQQASLKFIYKLTQRFTGEFAIRPILEADPTQVLPIMQAWAHDPSVHVRRLASEGIRMRLPWAKKNRIFLEHSRACIEIIDTLHSDPSRFVQKSVANNLNDLSKEDEALFQKIITRWSKGSPSKETQWIIRHASRSLRRKAS